MVPEQYHDFFLGTAGAAAALVGLLFVAITVAPHPIVGPKAAIGHQVRASSALSALLSPLVMSLIALIPGVNVGWVADSAAGLGLLFVLATAMRVWRAPRTGELRGIRPVLVGFVVLSVLFAYYGTRLIASPHGEGALAGVAGCVVASLSVGVNRAWGLVGARSDGLTMSIRDILGLSSSGATRHPEE